MTRIGSDQVTGASTPATIREMEVGLEWCVDVDGGCLLKVQAQPRASETVAAGVHGDPPRLKIRIAAPPVDGEANEELLRFLRKTLGVPLNRLRLVRGETSKMKDVRISGATAADVRGRLHPRK